MDVLYLYLRALHINYDGFGLCYGATLDIDVRFINNLFMLCFFFHLQQTFCVAT